MRHKEPLRISCDGCPGGCDDCLVEFFIAEREAQVVRLGGEEAAARSQPASTAPTAAAPPPLDPDLERALATLVAAGLNPKVIEVRPNQRGVSRAS